VFASSSHVRIRLLPGHPEVADRYVLRSLFCYPSCGIMQKEKKDRRNHQD
jgi:hypothetical protein